MGFFCLAPPLRCGEGAGGEVNPPHKERADGAASGSPAVVASADIAIESIVAALSIARYTAPDPCAGLAERGLPIPEHC